MYINIYKSVCVLVLTVLLKRVKYTFACTYQRGCLILILKLRISNVCVNLSNNVTKKVQDFRLQIHLLFNSYMSRPYRPPSGQQSKHYCKKVKSLHSSNYNKANKTIRTYRYAD
jgi:hypothetical protein